MKCRLMVLYYNYPVVPILIQIFVVFSSSPNSGSSKFTQIHFRKGTKGPKLILDGYSYFKNNGSVDRTYWLCSHNRYGKCKARIITMNSTKEIVIKNQNHNHSPDDPYDINKLEVITFDAVLKMIHDWEK